MEHGGRIALALGPLNEVFLIWICSSPQFPPDEAQLESRPALPWIFPGNHGSDRWHRRCFRPMA